jgi:hypothetical protein
MARELRVVAILAAALTISVSSAHAQAPGLQLGPAATAELKGEATFFQLRIPFGGREQESVRPTITLNAGPLYREQSDASYLRGQYYAIPSVRMGYSVDGDPVLTVGSTDLTKKPPRARRQSSSLLRFFRR